MADSMNGPFVVRPGEAREIGLGHRSKSLLAGVATTGGAFTLLDAPEVPGFGPPMHIHHNCAESFYVVEGEYRMFIAGRAFDCPAGSFVYIPSGVEHTFQVGAVASRKLNLFTPAAMEGYYLELSEAVARGAEGAELDEIAARNGMEITGPVPEGYL